MEKSIRRLTLILIIALTTAVSAQDENQDKVTAAQISNWIAMLNSDSFGARTAATDRLILAGDISIAPVLAAAKNGELETVIRCVYVLRQLAMHGDTSEVRSTAYDALNDLVRLEFATASRRATSAVIAVNNNRHSEARRVLEELGAKFSLSRSGPGVGMTETYNTVIFDKSWRGSPENLEHLKWLTLGKPDRKWMITMEGEQINDQWLHYIATLTTINAIRVKSGKVTDDGVARLSDLPQLESLELLYIPVTDASVGELKKIPNLQLIKIYGTDVTAAAAQQLQADLANTEVDHRQGGFLGIGCEDQPFRVTVVRKGTAAEKAGLQFGDVITRFNDEPVTSMTELTELIAKNRVGDTVSIDYERGNQKFKREITLGEWE